MNIIEGFGDEVTVFVAIFLVIMLGIIFSFINHQPSPVLVEEQDDVPASEPASVVERNNNISRNYPERSGTHNSFANSVNNDNIPEINVMEVEENSDLQKDDQSETENASEDRPATSENSSNTSERSSLDQLTIRLKYLDDTERTVLSVPSASIVDFKQAHFAEDLRNNKAVRLIFGGQLLQDSATLESYRILNNSVIHVQIIAINRSDRQRIPVAQSSDIDLSNLLWPLVSLIVCICWFALFKYSELFSYMSTTLLCVFTFSLFVLYTHHYGNRLDNTGQVGGG